MTRGPSVVAVPVAGLWTSPLAPREVDALAVADQPDLTGWVAALDTAQTTDPYAGRLGLHDRLESQVMEAERVLVIEEGADGWARVVCLDQPSSRDERGYPGWLRAAHLGPGGESGRAADAPGPGDPDAEALLAAARTYAGTPYLWGGMTAYGIDCSGLVHMAARSLGIRLPRDAHDQQAASAAVPVEEVQPGDLYFFAHPGRLPHHVGIVTASGRMLDAPEAGAVVVEEPLTDERRATLVGAGRVRGIR